MVAVNGASTATSFPLTHWRSCKSVNRELNLGPENQLVRGSLCETKATGLLRRDVAYWNLRELQSNLCVALLPHRNREGAVWQKTERGNHGVCRIRGRTGVEERSSCFVQGQTPVWQIYFTGNAFLLFPLTTERVDETNSCEFASRSFRWKHATLTAEKGTNTLQSRSRELDLRRFSDIVP